MKKSGLLQRKYKFLVFSLVFVTLVEILVLLSFTKKIDSVSLKPSNNLTNYAINILKACEKVNYKPSCYDTEIPKLMDSPTSLTMEEAFGVTQLIQEKDQQYLYCHTLGHKLSAKETQKNPKDWKDVLTRCPTTICNNGCLHGSLMEKFKSEYLNDEEIEIAKKELIDVCEPRGNWNPVEVEISMCYHAIGHLNMYITNANIDKSLELCNYIGTKPDGRSYVETCTEGVFMQVFQHLDPEDYDLVKRIKPTKDQVENFCLAYQGAKFAWDACNRESWALFAQELRNPQGLETLCSYTKDVTQQRRCYASVMNFITGVLVIDQDSHKDLQEYCRALPKEIDNLCFRESARRLIQIDPKYTEKAIEICDMAKETLGDDTCYNMLAYYATITFHPDSAEFREYCDRLPIPWNNICTSKQWDYKKLL